MRIDKTKASIALGALLVLCWLFRNPATLSMRLVGTAVLLVSLCAWSLMKAVDVQQTKGSKFRTNKIFLATGFALIVFGIGMYVKTQIMGVEDTKLAIADMYLEGVEKPDAWGNPIKKQKGEDNIETYSSAGRDEVFGTEDDIKISFGAK